MSAAATIAPSAPFAAEPSQPIEREKQHLPPKTYADATENPPDNVNRLENTPPTQFVGKGEADTQRSPPFSSPRHKKSGSLRLNGASRQGKPRELIVEDIQDKSGERLTSLKLAFDDKPKPQRTQTELVSGRRAGASWERSQCVNFTLIAFHLQTIG